MNTVHYYSEIKDDIKLHDSKSCLEPKILDIGNEFNEIKYSETVSQMIKRLKKTSSEDYYNNLKSKIGMKALFKGLKFKNYYKEHNENKYNRNGRIITNKNDNKKNKLYWHIFQTNNMNCIGSTDNPTNNTTEKTIGCLYYASCNEESIKYLNVNIHLTFNCNSFPRYDECFPKINNHHINLSKVLYTPKVKMIILSIIILIQNNIKTISELFKNQKLDEKKIIHSDIFDGINLILETLKCLNDIFDNYIIRFFKSDHGLIIFIQQFCILMEEIIIDVLFSIHENEMFAGESSKHDVFYNFQNPSQCNLHILQHNSKKFDQVAPI
ncbi:hypothetical protein H8356DRAFT_1323675 [Neocallimastix lanati (nom. inval.)]|nr:hypothetical protein H8356DRAFT_1323675 [Neocallimastix sp. JGI-2020a]